MLVMSTRPTPFYALEWPCTIANHSSAGFSDLFSIPLTRPPVMPLVLQAPL